MICISVIRVRKGTQTYLQLVYGSEGFVQYYIKYTGRQNIGTGKSFEVEIKAN